MTMAHESASFDLTPAPRDPPGVISEQNEPLTAQYNVQAWGFGDLKAEVSLRGGGCASSLLCDTVADGREGEHSSSSPEPPGKSSKATPVQPRVESGDKAVSARSASPVWRGWAELENDPEIFTILLQEWGVPNLHVQEIIDVAELITARPDETLGLILLSRYVAPDTNAANTTTVLSHNISQPWFANQISKFSCGTVALMNVLMNSRSTSLSETLSNFKIFTSTFSAKDRGIALDENSKFRELHNSFSTKMDRMIVDVLLKDDAQKFKTRKAAEARQAKRAEQNSKPQRKRKRGGLTNKRKKKTSAIDEEEDTGFHFVAYVPAHGAVWEMDGLQAQPGCLGKIGVEQTWLNVAADDLMTKMQEAFSSGQDCSLMSISKISVPVAVTSEAERSRKQEDWAPFIEHMLRLHVEKGDLQELLGL